VGASYTFPHVNLGTSLPLPYVVLNGLAMSVESWQRSLYVCDATGNLVQFTCDSVTGQLYSNGVVSDAKCNALAISPDGCVP
jgi:hypothetical protein